MGAAKKLLWLGGTVAAATALNRQRRRGARMALEGRVVVITGGSRGLGFALAQQAARERAHVVIAARSEEALHEAAFALQKRGAPDLMAVSCDISSPEEVQVLVSRVLDRYGRIDVLVNNAGEMRVGPVEALTPGDFERVLSTNAMGMVNTTLAVLPGMRSRGDGRICNINSLAGRLALPHFLPYTMSKFACTGFTDALRAEVEKDGIHVTGVYPSTMRTGGHMHAFFLGAPEREYAWFSSLETHPLLSMPVEQAARRIWQAIEEGRDELLLGWPAQLLFMGQTWTRVGLRRAIALAERWLPAPTLPPGAPRKGEQLMFEQQVSVQGV